VADAHPMLQYQYTVSASTPATCPAACQQRQDSHALFTSHATDFRAMAMSGCIQRMWDERAGRANSLQVARMTRFGAIVRRRTEFQRGDSSFVCNAACPSVVLPLAHGRAMRQRKNMFNRNCRSCLGPRNRPVQIYSRMGCVSHGCPGNNANCDTTRSVRD